MFFFAGKINFMFDYLGAPLNEYPAYAYSILHFRIYLEEMENNKTNNKMNELRKPIQNFFDIKLSKFFGFSKIKVYNLILEGFRVPKIHNQREVSI